MNKIAVTTYSLTLSTLICIASCKRDVASQKIVTSNTEVVKPNPSGDLKSKIAANFPKSIGMPSDWGKVLDWVEKNPGLPLSGILEIEQNSKRMMSYWVDSTTAEHYAAIMISGKDAPIALWKRSETSMPVVLFLDGNTVAILANSLEDFIELLAIGYLEPNPIEYLNAPVYRDDTKHHINTEFKKYYTATFSKTIPTTAQNVHSNIAVTNGEANAFLKKLNKGISQ